MSKSEGASKFEAKLLRPKTISPDKPWSFLILPKRVSDILPRRGRTSVEGTLNGHPFQATLEPDGQLSHWLKVGEELRKAADVDFGETVILEISPVEEEPEPEVPADLDKALSASPKAKEVWATTTTIARMDWIHWIESAKQSTTRQKRIVSACDMLTKGKKLVCCFDASGFYSKSLRAPDPEVRS